MIFWTIGQGSEPVLRFFEPLVKGIHIPYPYPLVPGSKKWEPPNTGLFLFLITARRNPDLKVQLIGILYWSFLNSRVFCTWEIFSWQVFNTAARVNQQPPMHQLRMSPFNPFCGWTSSLPVEIFFFNSSLPRNSLPPASYLPPPTYHLPSPPPHTPSPELQRPRAAVERELELWLWSGSRNSWSWSWTGWSWSGTHAPTKR